MLKLSDRDFDALVSRAVSRLPAEFRACLDNVTVAVRKRPTRSMLADVGLGPDETLYGLYEGVPLPEESYFDDGAVLPGTIFIFQEPLLEDCATLEELEEEILITVVHEVAHLLGIDEERLGELGYD